MDELSLEQVRGDQSCGTLWRHGESLEGTEIATYRFTLSFPSWFPYLVFISLAKYIKFSNKKAVQSLEELFWCDENSCIQIMSGL